jgi:hypothetical protein
MARVDLVIGRPATDEASVVLVRVTSGDRWPTHREDRHFHALVETLRSTVPPFAVGTYYARTGEVDVDPVTAELLTSAARRCRAGIEAMGVPERSGSPAAPSVHPWCAWCAALPLRDSAPTVPPVPVLEPVDVVAEPDPPVPPVPAAAAGPQFAAVDGVFPVVPEGSLSFRSDRAA